MMRVPAVLPPSVPVSSFPAVPRPSPAGWLALTSALVLAVAGIDAATRPHAFYDLWVLNAIQPIELPHIRTVLHAIEALTDSTGAVASWVAVLLGFVAARRWGAALAVGLIPLGGALNLLLGVLIGRTRPHLETLMRGSQNVDERSFPSGHAMGAVLLWGFLIVALARAGRRRLVLPLQTVALLIIVLAGFQRVWGGAHWPSDVVGGYAGGLLLLVGLLAVEARAEPAATFAFSWLRRIGAWMGLRRAA